MTICFLIVGFLRVFNAEDHKAAMMDHFVSIAGLIYIAWTLSFIAKVFYLGCFRADAWFSISSL